MAGKKKASVPEHHISGFITVVWIDKLFDILRKVWFSDFFDKNEIWLARCGLYGLYVSALLGLIVSVVFPIRYGLPYGFSIGIGIAWSCVCIVTHYTAYKFLPVITSLLRSTPSSLSSKAFLDSLAVVTGIGGIVFFCGGIYLWIKTSSFNSFVGAFFIFMFCAYLLSLFLNPKSLNIKIAEATTAGEECLGIISFFVKSFLKLVPIMFGAGVIFGVINLIELLFMKIDSLPLIIEKVTQVGNLTAAAFLPIAGYLIFIAYGFIIEIATSILAIPHKFDK